MNKRGNIFESTQLLKNINLSSIKASVHNGIDTERKRKNGIRTPRPGKNSHLAMFDDEPIFPKEHSSIHSNDCSLNEAQISSSVLEVYGCEVPDNRSIEEVFKIRQMICTKMNKPTVDKWLLSSCEELLNHCEPTKEHYSSSVKTKSKEGMRGRENSKNILMRNLLGNKMESIQLGWPSTSTFSKDHDSDCISEFVEMPGDPDILFRPEVMDKGVLEDKLIDDGYRFFHHGVKKTIPSRRYLMDNIDDDDFLFKKKL